jgi:hypothetical protein
VEGDGMEGKGRDGKGREGKGMEGTGRDGMGREGKGSRGRKGNRKQNRIQQTVMQLYLRSAKVNLKHRPKNEFLPNRWDTNPAFLRPTLSDTSPTVDECLTLCFIFRRFRV